jgi:hypothetical protein
VWGEGGKRREDGDCIEWKKRRRIQDGY